MFNKTGVEVHVVAVIVGVVLGVVPETGSDPFTNVSPVASAGKHAVIVIDLYRHTSVSGSGLHPSSVL